MSFNEMYMSVDNGDINYDYCYMNSSNGSKSKNHNSIDYTNKRDEISTTRYLMENNRLTNSVGIGIMLTASTLNQYANMEYNDE